MTQDKNIKIMKKPYHIVFTDSAHNEVARCTALVADLRGPNADGKNMKTKEGKWIRQFSVTDAGNTDLAVGSTFLTVGGMGEFPTTDAMKVNGQDVMGTVTIIPGLRAPKPRKAKVQAQAAQATSP